MRISAAKNNGQIRANRTVLNLHSIKGMQGSADITVLNLHSIENMQGSADRTVLNLHSMNRQGTLLREQNSSVRVTACGP